MGKNLLIEVGVEEIPSRFLNDISTSFTENFINLLKKEEIEYKSIRSYATPRRLVIYFEDILTVQKDKIIKIKGPKRIIAFSQSGEPTSALIGFMKKNQAKIEDLKFEKVGNDEYVFLEKKIEGKLTKEIIQNNFNDLLLSIPLERAMRWDDISFVRPIRWLVVMLDDEIIKVKVGKVESNNKTQPFLKTKENLKIPNAKFYFELMENEGIVLSFFERKDKILDELKNYEKELGIKIDYDEDLLNEVANLVESPKVFCLTLPSKGKEVPLDILTGILKKGVRVFPSFKENEIVYVFGVQNGIKRDSEIIKDGFYNLIKAKIEDAIFFYKKDKEISLKDRIDGLKNIIFEKKLGTYYDKTLRMIKLLSKISNALKINEEERILLDRAALLSYADLVSLTVQEYPELHGTVGKILSIHSKEDKRVSEIIGEFIYPRKRGDILPSSTLAKILGIIDRVDTIVGSFIINLEPTSKEDPFGIRRISFSLLELLISFENKLSLSNLIDSSLSTYQEDLISNFDKTNLIGFLKGRFKVILEDKGIDYDIINCVLNLKDIYPYYTNKNAEYIKTIMNQSDFIEFVKAYKRVFNIVKDYKNSPEIDPNLLNKKEEKELYEVYLSFKENFFDKEIHEFKKFFENSKIFVEKINDFFDNVLVMDEDEKIKNNRLSLLKEILNNLNLYGSFEEIIKT